MWEKSQKRQTNDEQNQFTAYLVVAVHNHRSNYLKRVFKNRNQEVQIGVELSQFHSSASATQEPEDYMQIVEDTRLWNALHQMKSRDRYILFSRVLDEKAFGQIAAELNLPYGTVAVSYHRTIKKLRSAMAGEDKQDG